MFALMKIISNVKWWNHCGWLNKWCRSRTCVQAPPSTLLAHGRWVVLSARETLGAQDEKHPAELLRAPAPAHLLTGKWDAVTSCLGRSHSRLWPATLTRPTILSAACAAHVGVAAECPLTLSVRSRAYLRPRALGRRSSAPPGWWPHTCRCRRPGQRRARWRGSARRSPAPASCGCCPGALACRPAARWGRAWAAHWPEAEGKCMWVPPMPKWVTPPTGDGLLVWVPVLFLAQTGSLVDTAYRATQRSVSWGSQGTQCREPALHCMGPRLSPWSGNGDSGQ